MDSSSSFGSRPVVSSGPGSVAGPKPMGMPGNKGESESAPSSPLPAATIAAAAAVAAAAAAARWRYAAHTLAMCRRRSLGDGKRRGREEG